MTWTQAGSIAVNRGWQYTEPILEGTYFRLKHTNAPIGGLFAVALCEVGEDGELSIGNSQVLEVEKGINEIIQFPIGAYSERRIAIKRFATQPNLEQEIRRLFLPNFLIAQTEIVNYIKRNNWQIEIEVSDYVETGSLGGGSTEANANSFYTKVKALNPYFYWRLGELSGVTAGDETTNNRLGTYQGSYTLNQPSSLAKDSNPSISLVPKGQVVSSLLPMLPINSILLRFKHTNSANQGLLNFASSPNADFPNASNLGIYCQNGQISITSYAGTRTTYTSPQAYNDGIWHTLAATFSTNGRQKLYIDGGLVIDEPFTYFQSFDGYWRLGFAYWEAGSNAYSAYYTGSFDDFFIANFELSAAQISELHTATL